MPERRDVSCVMTLAVPLQQHRTHDKERFTPPLLDLWLGAKLCRCAVPSAFVFAIRAARDTITRPIPGARPAGQRKRCSKTLPAFLSDAARAFAASMRLTRRIRPPRHSF